jgi:hypothetical protein
MVRSVQEVRALEAQSGKFLEERKQEEGLNSPGNISESQERTHWEM